MVTEKAYRHLGLPLKGKTSELWNYVDQREEAEE
jgi:hypothetical protein